MASTDVIITFLEEHEDFEAAPTEPRMPVAEALEDLAETQERVSVVAAIVETRSDDS